MLCALGFLFLLTGSGSRTTPGEQTLIDQGNALHQKLSPAMVEDARLKVYLQQVGARMLAAARDVMREKFSGKEESDWKFSKDIQFHVARSSIPNAFSTGGHHVYVLLPALQRCQNEDELAAALAHAYSHTLLRHIEHNVPVEGADAPAGAIALRFAEHRFSPAQEQEADSLAFAIHARAGWDPVAFASMLEHMEAERGRVAAIQSSLERLPPAAQEWSKPPIADAKRFEGHKAQAASVAAQKRAPQAVELVLSAFPNCFTPQDLSQQREAQRELATPISTDTPNTFEKGQRR
jgi:predicted Zn-dependent protease